MPYWRLFYHIIWATKDRRPLIDPAWEADLHGYMRGKATALECIVHAVGGMPDHMHIVVSIPPKLAVAMIVGKLKGASSHYVNERFVAEDMFAWQNEYGVLSCSENALTKIVDYVTNQKKHHLEQSLDVKLERI